MCAAEGAGTRSPISAIGPALALALLIAGAAAARADDGDCDVPMENWQPREAVEAMARAQGWTIARLRIDDGCYQLRGTDAEGRPFKMKIDPETLEIVKTRRGGWHGQRDGQGQGQGSGQGDGQGHRQGDDDDHALPPPPPAAAPDPAE